MCVFNHVESECKYALLHHLDYSIQVANECLASLRGQYTCQCDDSWLEQAESVMRCSPEDLESFKKDFLPVQSLPKFGQPDDIADVKGLLCWLYARWIIGSCG